MKQEHWAREFNERGPEATLEASQALWQHIRLLRPERPSDQERLEDLAHHIALKRAIDRAARAFVFVTAHGDAVDVERIRATLRLLETALDRGDLVSALEGVLATARRGARGGRQEGTP